MSNIAKVLGGLGTATDADVLEGVVYSSENGIRRVGTGTSVKVASGEVMATYYNGKYNFAVTTGFRPKKFFAQVTKLANYGFLVSLYIDTENGLAFYNLAYGNTNCVVTSFDYNITDTGISMRGLNFDGNYAYKWTAIG